MAASVDGLTTEEGDDGADMRTTAQRHRERRPGGGAHGYRVDGRPGGSVADGGLAAARTAMGAMGATGMAWRRHALLDREGIVSSGERSRSFFGNEAV
jgi:hypothetical protein